MTKSDFNEFVDCDISFSFDEERNKLLTNLKRLKSMDVQEFTFYKKWKELKQPGIERIVSDSEPIRKNIWKPTDIFNEQSTIEEIEKIIPEVIFVNEGSDYYDIWNKLRLFCHTMEFSQNPGRFLRFLVIDKRTKKYLGVTSVASDVITITDRDKYLGWSSENKLKDKKLSNSSIGSCIMATQPLGYNFLGGKFIACLITSDVIRNTWKNLYNQTLVGMTTTSLYGSYSMYNNLKWWHKCGSSSGKMLIVPDQECYNLWHNWIKENKTLEYIKMMQQKDGVSGPVTSAKMKIISMIMNSCEIKPRDFTHGYERGIYYSCFYENTKEFLQNKTEENKLILKPLIKNGVKSILEWWIPKAINRYKKLLSENRINHNILWYADMIDMTYEEAKSKYYSDVGKGK